MFMEEIKMDYKGLAKTILKDIGGEENVISFTHCATRLRFNLRDESKADTEHLKEAKGVMGVVSSGGQYQVVIGSSVPNVYRELNALGNFESDSPEREKSDDGKSAFIRVLDTVSGIFTPVIPAITGAGILKAVMALLKVAGWIDADSQTYKILTVFADAAFYFLPFLLAYSTAKKFRCSIVVAMSIAGILLHPDFSAMLSGGGVRFIGIPVIGATYSSSVIPIILSIWFMSFVEPIADRISPSAVKFFTKPLITLVVTGAAAVLVLGPLGAIVGDGIAIGISFLNRYARWLVPTLIGVFSPFLVMTGTHYGLIPIGINNIATVGVDTIVGPGMLGSNIAQGGAAFAVAIKTKNKDFRQLSVSSGITAVCGITEPAMYGVNLRLKKPLIPVMIAGGVSGLFMGLMSVGRYTTGSPGLLALPGYIGTEGIENITYAVIGCVIAFAIGFVGTLLIGFEDVSAQEKTAADTKVGSGVLCAPIKGRVVPLAQVDDPTFAEEVLGKGAAIAPETNLLVAPSDGKIENIPQTKHAIAMTTTSGAEILMHIGMDTVNLKGRHFKTYVSEGDSVKMGDPLIEFDAAAIKSEGYDLTTPIVITNSGEFELIETMGESATEQKPFMRLEFSERG